MHNNLATGFLKMLKSDNNIDDRTMALIARASSVKKLKPKALTTVVLEQNMLDGIDEIEELDNDETKEKSGEDTARITGTWPRRREPDVQIPRPLRKMSNT